MRFPPLLPSGIHPVLNQYSKRLPSSSSNSHRSQRRLTWPVISALVSALLSVLSSLAGCHSETNPPETTPSVENAPGPDNQIGSDPTTTDNNVNRSSDLPNMDEAREDDTLPPGNGT